jgi:hypothetical protein
MFGSQKYGRNPSPRHSNPTRVGNVWRPASPLDHPYEFHNYIFAFPHEENLQASLSTIWCPQWANLSHQRTSISHQRYALFAITAQSSASAKDEILTATVVQQFTPYSSVSIVEQCETATKWPQKTLDTYLNTWPPPTASDSSFSKCHLSKQQGMLRNSGSKDVAL